MRRLIAMGAVLLAAGSALAYDEDDYELQERLDEIDREFERRELERQHDELLEEIEDARREVENNAAYDWYLQNLGVGQ